MLTLIFFCILYVSNVCANLHYLFGYNDPCRKRPNGKCLVPVAGYSNRKICCYCPLDLLCTGVNTLDVTRTRCLQQKCSRGWHFDDGRLERRDRSANAHKILPIDVSKGNKPLDKPDIPVKLEPIPANDENLSQFFAKILDGDKKPKSKPTTKSTKKPTPKAKSVPKPKPIPTPKPVAKSGVSNKLLYAKIAQLEKRLDDQKKWKGGLNTLGMHPWQGLNFANPDTIKWMWQIQRRYAILKNINQEVAASQKICARAVTQSTCHNANHAYKSIGIETKGKIIRCCWCPGSSACMNEFQAKSCKNVSCSTIKAKATPRKFEDFFGLKGK